jgi:hypothetical protein
MRILHISHAGLPDIRVEKTAMTMKRLGHEMVFLGGRPVKGQHTDVFDETHHIQLANSLRVVFDPTVKRKWLKQIGEIAPDVVHAHNCVVGHFMTSSSLPVIFNDHELMSKQTAKFDVRPFIRRMAVKPMAMMFPRWEKSLASQYPTITTHPNMTAAHQQNGDFVVTVPNVPLRQQVENLSRSGSREGTVYVGSDIKLARFLPHRNLQGLKDLIPFDVITGVPYEKMMAELTNYKVGLTAWHPHPWHIYSDANKNYEYMHAGLPVITNHLIKEALFSDIPFVYGFKSYDEIPSLLSSMMNIDHESIREYALKHYVWENYEGLIIDVYNKV